MFIIAIQIGNLVWQNRITENSETEEIRDEIVLSVVNKKTADTDKGSGKRRFFHVFKTINSNLAHFSSVSKLELVRIMSFSYLFDCH